MKKATNTMTKFNDPWIEEWESYDGGHSWTMVSQTKNENKRCQDCQAICTASGYCVMCGRYN